jgi:hypothetical protein
MQTVASAWVRTLGMGGPTTSPGSRVALMRYSAASLSVDVSLANTSPAMLAAALSSIASPFLTSLAAGGASTIDYNRVVAASMNQFLQHSVQVTGLKVLLLFATNAPALNFSSSVRFVSTFSGQSSNSVFSLMCILLFYDALFSLPSLLSFPY